MTTRDNEMTNAEVEQEVMRLVADALVHGDAATDEEKLALEVVKRGVQSRRELLNEILSRPYETSLEEEPGRTRSLVRGAIAFTVSLCIVLGGICWALFWLGGLFTIGAWVVALVLALLLWRSVIQLVDLLRGEWYEYRGQVNGAPVARAHNKAPRVSGRPWRRGGRGSEVARPAETRASQPAEAYRRSLPCEGWRRRCLPAARRSSSTRSAGLQRSFSWT